MTFDDEFVSAKFIAWRSPRKVGSCPTLSARKWSEGGFFQNMDDTSSFLLENMDVDCLEELLHQARSRNETRETRENEERPLETENVEFDKF